MASGSMATRRLLLDNRALSDELKKRLPRLIFAAYDDFPVAGGRALGSGTATDDVVPVIAVRSLSVEERLDADTIVKLKVIASGARHFETPARSLDLQLPVTGGRAGYAAEAKQDAADTVKIVVSWHDVHDFVALLLRGNPTCVDAVASEAPAVFTSDDWSSLRAAFNRRCCDAVRAGKTYRMACAGPLQSLLMKRQGPKGSKRAHAVGELDVGSLPTVVGLCKRAATGAPDQLVARIDELYGQGELGKDAWGNVVTDLVAATSGLPHSTMELPAESLDEWVDAIRNFDFVAFAKVCAASCVDGDTGASSVEEVESTELDRDWAERLANVWPHGAKLAFMAQTGSFMYGVQTPSSDSDFSIVFLTHPELLARRKPPSAEFQHHVNAGFGADKLGEIEYSGREFGSFLVELAKGNPRNIELLFTSKPHASNWAWRELRQMRRDFLTLRCAKQYLGFISDQLRKAQSICDEDRKDGFKVASGAKISKRLYHAHHKMFELARVLEGDEPKVALDGTERDFVMTIRLRPPQSFDEASELISSAESKRAALSNKLDALPSEAFPAEVDAARIISWLQSVRRRQIVQQASKSCPGVPPGAPPFALPLKRDVSRTGDVEAIRAFLEEIEEKDGIRIVHAAYGPSSRTLGTDHEGSDHDVKCIFVLRRRQYFGLRPIAKTFKHKLPAGAGMTDVEVSGWEARHACRLLADSNPTVMHVLSSPIEFITSQWGTKMRDTAMANLNLAKLKTAWYQHAQDNYKTYIKKVEEPIRKKYVHVLRPLLCLAWLRRCRGDTGGSATMVWPPSTVVELCEAVSGVGGLSNDEVDAIVALVGNRNDLPNAMPREQSLDSLIERLLRDEAADKSAPNTSSVAEQEALWHELCVDMIEDMSNF